MVLVASLGEWAVFPGLLRVLLFYMCLGSVKIYPMTVSNVTGRQFNGQRWKKDPGPPDKLPTNLLYSQNKTNEQASGICNFSIQVKKLRQIKQTKIATQVISYCSDYSIDKITKLSEQCVRNDRLRWKKIIIQNNFEFLLVTLQHNILPECKRLSSCAVSNA